MRQKTFVSGLKSKECDVRANIKKASTCKHCDIGPTSTLCESAISCRREMMDLNDKRNAEEKVTLNKIENVVI